MERQDATFASTAAEPPELVRIRGQQSAHLRSMTSNVDVDNVGHARLSTAGGFASDEEDDIVSHQIPVLLGGDGAWMWRTERSWTDGPGAQALGETTNEYNDEGDLTHTAVIAALPTAHPMASSSVRGSSQMAILPAT
ncbi:MAG: hypothetical protein IT379_31230 [Deltaproteobacteria bacterium]|nr:hypothetical protein [Deltaproteobacteria bacterium]